MLGLLEWSVCPEASVGWGAVDELSFKLGSRKEGHPQPGLDFVHGLHTLGFSSPGGLSPPSHGPALEPPWKPQEVYSDLGPGEHGEY